VDHGARYQLLDYANDDSFLWDVRLPLTIIHRSEGWEVSRHQERSVEELRPELEELLRAGHLELYEATGRDAPRTLSLDEAIAVAADDRNWYTEKALGEPYDGHRSIYGLSLTQTGEGEYQQEQERANRI
jgi:hypothetical protein